MKYIFSYYVEEPCVIQKPTPWWLFWRKTLPEVKLIKIRRSCCAELPDDVTQSQLIEILTSFTIPDSAIWMVQLEEAENHYKHSNYITTQGCNLQRNRIMSDQNIEQMDKGLPQVKFWERNLQRTEVDIQNHIKFYNLDYEFIDRETLLERIKELETALNDIRRESGVMGYDFGHAGIHKLATDALSTQAEKDHG